MSKWAYTKGLHDLGNGCWAWLQPDGSWGYSNAGLIVDGKESLLVGHAVRPEAHARDARRHAQFVPQAARIGTVFNTHGNDDHTFGNQLVKDARIIATKGTLADMEHRPPEQLYQMMTRNWQALGEAGRFMYEMMGSKLTSATWCIRRRPSCSPAS